MRKLSLFEKAAGVMAGTNGCRIRPEIASLFFAGMLAQKDPKIMPMLIKSASFKSWNEKHKQLLDAYKV